MTLMIIVLTYKVLFYSSFIQQDGFIKFKKVRQSSVCNAATIEHNLKKKTVLMIIVRHIKLLFMQCFL